MNNTNPFVLIRGGGDLGTGAAYRLHRCGIPVIVADLPNPLCVRRLVCLSEAIHQGAITIENVTARLAHDFKEATEISRKGDIPVMVDEDGNLIQSVRPAVVMDARMRKIIPENEINGALLVIGLGPGFSAGVDCHAVVETNRGADMGRVIWQGSAEKDTRIPESVGSYREERVLRASVAGEFHTMVEIGAHVQAGQPLFEIAGKMVTAPFKGVIRGLLTTNAGVTQGMKVGDIDPRDDDRLCVKISDKALAVGGGVVEAVLSKPEIRKIFYSR